MAEVDDIVREALELRFTDPGDGNGPLHLPSSESGPSQVLESLLRTRRALDRVEYLLLRATLLRGKVQATATSADAQAKDAWDQASVTNRSRGSGGAGDYSGPRERYADASLATISEQRASRAALAEAERAKEAVDVVRVCHRGLDSLRQDHVTVLRALTIASSLEQ